MKRLLLLFASLFLLPALHAAPSAEARMSSMFLTRGEQAFLEVIVQGGEEPDSLPVVPEIPNVTMRPMGASLQPRFLSNRRRQLDYVFRYVVSSYEKGRHTIPPVEVTFGSEVVKTSPVTFEIFDDMSLEWSTVDIDGTPVRYAAAFRSAKDRPFVGETTPVEIKLYFPAEQRVEDWGVPDFERDGLSAWRFQPQGSVGRATLLGRPYSAVSYPSTFSPNRDGTIAIGPAKMILQTVQFSVQDFGGASYKPANLVVPPLKLEARPLPADAPEGFENAVGRFQLSVFANEKEVREGDPVTVNLTITGSGNLDVIRPPKPLDDDGWKLYDASAVERGEERRELSGMVSFRQFMRPLRLQSTIPPFRLVYFDPDAETYQVLMTEPIPLTVLPSTAPPIAMSGPPPALPVPVESMSDILGLIQTPDAISLVRRIDPRWITLWVNLIPSILCLALLIRIYRIHFAPRFEKDPVKIARRQALQKVERSGDDAAGFYRSVGHFIEQWFGDSRDPAFREILAQRDQVAFRPDQADTKIDRGEKNRILKLLRRVALSLTLGFAMLMPDSASAEETPAAADGFSLFKESRYEAAAKAWLTGKPYSELSADTLFNVGNAAYRLGSPGDAALYYRRALDRDPSHAEARQNLRFLERKFGSISIKRPDYQYAIARLPLVFWNSLIILSAWIVILGVLVFFATHPGSGWRMTAIAGFVMAPLVAAIGIVAHRFYPDDARFAPPSEQVVVVGEQAVIRTDAARNSPRVIDAPAGSLARILERSGDWSYVAFTNDTRGWIQNQLIEPLRPVDEPNLPRVRTGKSRTQSDA